MYCAWPGKDIIDKMLNSKSLVSFYLKWYFANELLRDDGKKSFQRTED